MNKQKIINKIAEVKIRLDRGNSLIYWIKNIILLIASIKIIFDLNTQGAFIVGIIGVGVVFLLGLLDVNFFNLYQKENELIASKYNPHLNKIKRIKE